jgi:hypothetical protein
VMAAPNLESLARLSVEHALNGVALGIAVALFAWLVLRIVGRQNSGTRFAVWFAALLSIPAFTLLDGFHVGGSAGALRPEISMPKSWAPYLFAGWAVITAVGLARIGFGLWQVHQLKKACVAVSLSHLDATLRKTLEEFNSRAVTMCVSDRLQTPTVVGFKKATVVIPAWAMQELSLAELNVILLHELAHLRRWDDWTNLVQKIFGAVLFFQPALWWIGRELTLEREMACDEMVLAAASNPREYAACLVALAEKSLCRRGLALAQAAVNRIRQLSRRVSQILDVHRPVATGVWKPVVVLLAAAAMAGIAALPYAPKLVGFGDGLPSSALASKMDGPSMRQASEPSARLIPAKFETAPLARQAMASAVGKIRSVPRPRPTPTKTLQQPRAWPKPLRASLQEDANTSQTWIVIMQTRENDGSGRLTVWTVCVWRVTEGSPSHSRLIRESPGRSI